MIMASENGLVTEMIIFEYCRLKMEYRYIDEIGEYNLIKNTYEWLISAYTCKCMWTQRTDIVMNFSFCTKWRPIQVIWRLTDHNYV